MKLDMDKTFVVLDKATAHTSKAMQNWFYENDIYHRYLPTNSSQLNSVERIWSVLKSNLVKKFWSHVTSYE